MLSQPDSHAINDELANRSLFNGYATLAGIKASIIESRVCGSWEEATMHGFRDTLLGWLRSYEDQLVTTDTFCLMILWHSAFILLYTDVEHLEKASRRRDVDATGMMANTHDLYPWANSSDGHRCATHAVRILHHAERLRVTAEPAIHAAHNIFIAGLVLHQYTKYVPGGGDGQGQQMQSAHNEVLEEFSFGARGVNSNSRGLSAAEGRWPGAGPAERIERSTIFRCVDLLKRIGHGDRAREYAAELESLIHEIG